MRELVEAPEIVVGWNGIEVVSVIEGTPVGSEIGRESEGGRATVTATGPETQNGTERGSEIEMKCDTGRQSETGETEGGRPVVIVELLGM